MRCKLSAPLQINFAVCVLRKTEKQRSKTNGSGKCPGLGLAVEEHLHGVTAASSRAPQKETGIDDMKDP